jgi:hypothetical protein
MSKRTVCRLLLASALLLALASSALAASSAQAAQTYTIKLGDNLWTLAKKYLGSGTAWPALMATTNQMAIDDPSYNRITNADLIQPGWKLAIPSAQEAEDFLASYDPGKPEMLFGKPAEGQLVIGSWWTAGGEAEGLAGMFRIYKEKYPAV